MSGGVIVCTWWKCRDVEGLSLLNAWSNAARCHVASGPAPKICHQAIDSFTCIFLDNYVILQICSRVHPPRFITLTRQHNRVGAVPAVKMMHPARQAYVEDEPQVRISRTLCIAYSMFTRLRERGPSRRCTMLARRVLADGAGWSIGCAYGGPCQYT